MQGTDVHMYVYFYVIHVLAQDVYCMPRSMPY